MSEETRQDADKILDILEEKGWGKGGGWGGRSELGVDGPFCLGMAGIRVTPGTYSLIRKIAHDLFPSRQPRSIMADNYLIYSIPAFNDHPDTIWEDILLIIKHLREWDDD